MAGWLPWVAGCEVCDWVLLTVWELDPPGEEGTPFVWGAVEEGIVGAVGRLLVDDLVETQKRHRHRHKRRWHAMSLEGRV